MATVEENEVQRVLQRLLCDLESKKALCCCSDYPGVSEKILNEYLAQHGPLTNPVFGKMRVFWIDEGYFIPGRDVVPGCCELAPEIGARVSRWASWSGKRGSLMLPVGAYIYDKRSGTPTTVRMPDVTFIPRSARRDRGAPQLWKLNSGELYAPSFVVEIDRLSGEESQLDALDAKMCNEFFQHGVQLGWPIDPRPECRKVLEYKLDEAGKVYRVDDDSWRDLDGGAVLPGFHLSKTDMEIALDPNFDFAVDEGIDASEPGSGTAPNVLENTHIVGLLLLELALLQDVELDALALGQGHPGAGLLADGEHVAEARGEVVASRVLDVGNVERTLVPEAHNQQYTEGLAMSPEGVFLPLDVVQDADAARVTSARDGHQVADLELDVVHHLARLQVDLDRVADLDERVRVADGAAVVGGDVRDGLLGVLLADDLGELELLLLVRDAVQHEAALRVVQQAELVARLGQLHHVHEAGREVRVHAHLAVHLDALLHADHGDLLLGQGVLKAVAQDDDERQALAQLVRARRRARRPDAVQLAQHPVLGRAHALQVLAGSTRHLDGRLLDRDEKEN
ncbi:hypothetical protein ON010_g12774 [Phytophthora cinnamomi]|nr:hypothetical protein ON010_g12774 [Phytophthora cinnamomi]